MTYKSPLPTTINVKDFPFNAVSDEITITDGNIASGSHLYNSASAPFISTAVDAGKPFFAYKAGVSGAPLLTTIDHIVSPTQAYLTATASTTVSSGGQALFGTDNLAAINSAIAAKDAAGKGGVIFIPRGGYMVSADIDIGTTGTTIRGEAPNNQNSNHGTFLFFYNDTNGIQLSAHNIQCKVEHLLLQGPAYINPSTHLMTGSTGTGLTASPAGLNQAFMDVENVVVITFGTGFNPGSIENCPIHDLRCTNNLTGMTIDGAPTNLNFYNLVLQSNNVGASITNGGNGCEICGGLVQDNHVGIQFAPQTSSAVVGFTHSNVWFEAQGSTQTVTVDDGYDVVFDTTNGPIVNPVFRNCRLTADAVPWQFLGGAHSLNGLKCYDCIGNAPVLPGWSGDAYLDFTTNANVIGDMRYYDGHSLTRLPVGSSNQVLTIVSGIPTWQAISTINTTSAVSITSSASTINLTAAGQITATGVGGSFWEIDSSGDLIWSTNNQSGVFAEILANGTNGIAAISAQGTGGSVQLLAPTTQVFSDTIKLFNFAQNEFGSITTNAAHNEVQLNVGGSGGALKQNTRIQTAKSTTLSSQSESGDMIFQVYGHAAAGGTVNVDTTYAPDSNIVAGVKIQWTAQDTVTHLPWSAETFASVQNPSAVLAVAGTPVTVGGSGDASMSTAAATVVIASGTVQIQFAAIAGHTCNFKARVTIIEN